MNRIRIVFLASLLAMISSAVMAQAASAPSTPAPAAPASSASAVEPADKAPAEEVVEIDPKDPLIKAAFKKTQATLDTFLKLASDKRQKLATAALRVKVKQGRKVDYLWVTEFSNKGKRFKGSINDAPRHVTGIEAGQDWAFVRADIVDWMYIDASNVMHGNHTTCALLAKAPPADTVQMKKEYGLDCSK